MQNFTLSFQEHRRSIILSSVVLVIVLALGVVYAMFGNPFAPAITPSTKIAPHTPPKVVDFSQRQNASSTVHYLLPRSKVTPAYASIYNNMANEALDLTRAYNTEMFPLAAQIQTAAKNKDYEKLTNLGRSVRVVNDAQKVRLLTLWGDLSNLALANKNLTDPETMRLTDDLITTGRAMVAKDAAMAKLVDNLLAGKVSAESTNEAKDISGALAPSTKAFFAAAQKLSDYFALTLKSDIAAHAASSIQ